jgi:hypothetical protein
MPDRRHAGAAIRGVLAAAATLLRTGLATARRGRLQRTLGTQWPLSMGTNRGWTQAARSTRTLLTTSSTAHPPATGTATSWFQSRPPRTSGIRSRRHRHRTHPTDQWHEDEIRWRRSVRRRRHRSTSLDYYSQDALALVQLSAAKLEQTAGGLVEHRLLDDDLGRWLLPELVNELPDLGLGVAAVPTQRAHERQLAFLGPAGHCLGRNRQQLGHLSGQKVAGCLAALGLCSHRVPFPNPNPVSLAGPQPDRLVVACGPTAEPAPRSPCRCSANHTIIKTSSQRPP